MFAFVLALFLGFVAWDTGVVSSDGFDASRFDNPEHKLCQELGNTKEWCDDFDVFESDHNDEFDGN